MRGEPIPRDLCRQLVCMLCRYVSTAKSRDEGVWEWGLGSLLTFGIAAGDEMMMNVNSAEFGTPLGGCHV